MGSFLNPRAQPPTGAKSFLHNQRGYHQNQHQRYGARQETSTFLACEGGGVALNPISNDAGKNHRTFLQNYEPSSLAAGANESSAEPRTIAKDTLWSSVAGFNQPEDTRTTPNSPQQPQHKNSQTDNNFIAPAYTTAKDAHTDSTDTMASKPFKAVPPHLKHGNKAQQQSAPSRDKGAHSRTTGTDVREKLSELGVSVGAPKSATLATSTGWEGTGWNEPDKSPPTNKAGNNARGSTRGGRGSGRGGRGRGRGDKPPRSSLWPKKSDFPKLDNPATSQPPDIRWTWDDEPPQPPQPPKPRVYGFSSDGEYPSEGQNQDWVGVAVGGWDNSFEHAPVNWESRSAFRKDQSVEQIQDWLGTVGDEVEVSISDFETTRGITYTFGTSDGTTPDNRETKYQDMGDIVPHYWRPKLLDGVSPQTFWQGHINSNNPEPDEGIDLTGTRPWWELIVKSGTFLEVAEQPPQAGVNPREEKEIERLARESDEGNITRDANIKRFEAAKAAAKADRRRKKEQNRQKIILAQAADGRSDMMGPKFRPTTDFKLVIRPAQPTDMHEVHKIYNHYVDNSCVVRELDRVTPDDMLLRLKDIEARGLPFLVACEPGAPIRQGGKKSRRLDDDSTGPQFLPDKIHGFAYADDYNCPRSVYAFTAEVEVFVSNSFYTKGIGKCLMDKLMAMLDPGYMERGNYAISEELQNVTPERFIKNIIINLPYDNVNKFTWQRRWLENWLGFQLEADMEGVGNKSGKAVNLAIFRRPTSVELIHSAPPIISPLARRFTWRNAGHWAE